MIQSKEKYALLDKLNLCHRCEKMKPAPGRKYCFDCLDKIRAYNDSHYNPEMAKAYQSRRRELYQIHKKQGICVRCSQKATHGIYCYECSIKAKRNNAKTAERRKQERAERGLIPLVRAEDGLCLRCGTPLDTIGSMLCAVCTEQNRRNSALADKSVWRRMENARIEQAKNRG